MNTKRLLLSLALTIASVCSAFAANPKAQHVILIGLDGWGA